MLSGEGSLLKANCIDVGCYKAGSPLTISLISNHLPKNKKIKIKVNEGFKGRVFQVQVMKKVMESSRRSPEESSMLFWSAAFKSNALRQERVQRKDSSKTQGIQKAFIERNFS